MKIDARGSGVEIFGAETEEQVFQIATTAIAFETLSAKLYSDRITAVIRELACNAYDAHVSNRKKDVPFELGLPNDLTPEFRIRDFGHGMDDDQILELYCTYFASSKQSTNRQIGGFGIGSKSPFSYTSGFTVVSYQGGEARTYAAFVNEQRVPAIVRLSTEPADEPDGLEVKFSVKSSDFLEFRTKAQNVLEFFPVPPEVNLPGFAPAKAIYKIEGESWKLRDESYSLGLRIVQGFVPYAVKGIGEEEFGDLATVLQAPLDVFVPIGTLAPAASREVLTNDETTVRRLREILERVRLELQDSLFSGMEDLSSGYEKLSYLSQFHRDRTLGPIAKSLADSILHDDSLFSFTSVGPKDFPEISILRWNGRDWRVAMDGTTESIVLGLEKNYSDHEFVVCDQAWGAKSKLRRCENLFEKSRILAILPRHPPRTAAGFDSAAHVRNAMAVIKAFGSPPFMMLSDLHPPSSGRASQRTFSRWAGASWFRPDYAGRNQLWVGEGAYPASFYFLRSMRNLPSIFDKNTPSNQVLTTVAQMLAFLKVSKFELFSLPEAAKPPAGGVDLAKVFEAAACAWLLANPVKTYGSAYALGNLVLAEGSGDSLIDEALAISGSTGVPETVRILRSVAEVCSMLGLAAALKVAVSHDDSRAPKLAEEILRKYPLLTRSRVMELAKFYVDSRKDRDVTTEEEVAGQEGVAQEIAVEDVGQEVAAEVDQEIFPAQEVDF